MRSSEIERSGSQCGRDVKKHKSRAGINAGLEAAVADLLISVTC